MSEKTPGKSEDGVLHRLGVGAVAAVFNYDQARRIYQNDRPGLRPIRSPGEYPELRDFPIEENFLAVPAFRFVGKKENPAGVAGYVMAEPPRDDKICLWEKQAEPGKPHYLIFSSTNGHLGDAWPVQDPEHLEKHVTPKGRVSREEYVESVESNRRMPREFLRKIAESGAGFTAVSLRGYGKSDGEPSQAAHECDIVAVVHHLLKERKVPAKDIAVLGISLGTWGATTAAARMTDQGHPPLLLGLVNPFTSMVQLGTETINKDPAVKFLNVQLRRDQVEHPTMLFHPMETHKLVPRLSHDTKISIFTSGKDEIIGPHHSSQLVRAMYKHGLDIHQGTFPNAYHGTIPCDELIHVTQDALAHCAQTEESRSGRHGYWRGHVNGNGNGNGHGNGKPKNSAGQQLFER